jgi:glycosyltransferase involved in cell wall biosynthesis
MNYLIVTQIPFQRLTDNQVIIDELWARDLEGSVKSLENVKVIAPELSIKSKMQTWGPTSTIVKENKKLSFVGIPFLSSKLSFWHWAKIKYILKKEVSQADVVQTSNFFPPYSGLTYAHDYAVKIGKKTVFVVAEDFYDMLQWEWVRTSKNFLTNLRRQLALDFLDKRTRKSASKASLTLLHTPAAVTRYRLTAQNSQAIRQPEHEKEDVISQNKLEGKCKEIKKGSPLVLVTACRHKALKGLSLLVRAISLLKQLNVFVELRLYGSGEETESLKSLVQSLGLDDRIFFLGSLVPGEELYQAISECHAFIMPHRTNDFGRAFFDAMAAGTPVIAFRTPASSDTVRDNIDGLLVPLDDIEGLAAAIMRYHKDRNLLVNSAYAARERALVNTRSLWFNLRAEWTKALLEN